MTFNQLSLLRSQAEENTSYKTQQIYVPQYSNRRKKVFHSSKVNIQFFCYIDVLHTISSAPGMANTLRIVSGHLYLFPNHVSQVQQNSPLERSWNGDEFSVVRA